MNRPDPHTTWDELVVGHALYALEPDDEQAVLAHLPSCARCQRALEEHRETRGHLAYAPEPAEPPPALLEGIRAEVLRSSPRAYDGAPAASAAPHDELARARARRQPGRALRWTSVAAAAALVVSLGAWGLGLRSDLDAQSRRTDAYASALRAVESSSGTVLQLADPRGGRAVTAVLEADEVTLVVDGLPANDRTASTYVLWGQELGGRVRAVAPFDVRPGDVAVVRDLPVPADLRPGLRSLLVTLEPGREMPATTQEPVVASGTVA